MIKNYANADTISNIQIINIMNNQPNEIIRNIFEYVPKIKQINTLTLVCKGWYRIMKNIISKKSCKNFEDFILSDNIFCFPTYAKLFNNYIYFMPRICQTWSNLYKLIDKKYKQRKLTTEDDDIFLFWLFNKNLFELIKRLNKKMIKDIALCTDLAINNNNTDAVTFLCNLRAERGEYNSICDRAYYACCSGNLNMIKFLHQKFKYDTNEFLLLAGTAAGLNYLNIVEYCFEMGVHANYFDFCNYTYNDKYFYSGMIQLLKKYKTNRYSDQDLNIIQLVIDGDIDQLKHVHKHQFNLSNMSDLMIKIALATNNVNIVKCICEDSNSIVDVESKHIFENNISGIFMIAVRRGNLDIIKFLHQKYKSKIRYDGTYGNFNNYIACSFGTGNLEIIKFLFEQKFTIKNIDSCMYPSLANDKNNILPIIKYIYDKYPQKITDYDFVFDACCTHGSLNHFLYFKNLKKNNCLSNFYYVSACIEHNNISMLKYFYDK